MNKQREVPELAAMHYKGPFLVRLEHYQAGNPAIVILAQNEYGHWEPYMTASTNIPGLNKDEVAIKNYSENEGIEASLLELGVLGRMRRTVRAGFVEVRVFELNTSWWD